MFVDAPFERTGSIRARARASGLLTAAASVLVWLVVSPGQPSASASDVAAQSVVPRGRSFVCMTADGELAFPVGDDCAPGQSPVPLDSANAQGCHNDPWNPKDDPDADASTTPPDEASELEKSIKVAENRPVFEVVDQRDHPILQVLPCQILLSNAVGDGVLTLNGSDGGGFMTARNPNHEAISLGVVDDLGGVLITRSERDRVQYGKQAGGNFSLVMPVGSGYEAAIGESRAGTGALLIGDDFGRARALMSVVDGKGRIMTQNKAGSPVASMTEGESGAGMLVIGDASSEPMVKFSVTGNRYGAVLAGPVSGFPMVAGSGLPGSYILGCAGGPSCGPGGGGKR